MSVPYKIEAMEELLVGKNTPAVASSKIPIIAQPFVSERARKLLDVVCLHPLHRLNIYGAYFDISGREIR